MPIRTPVEERDAGLRRVSLLTRGAVAIGVALTGAFSALAAHAFPGRSGQRAAAGSVPTDAAAVPAAETTTSAPTTTTRPTTTASPTAVSARTRAAAAAAPRPLQPPVTPPRAVVAVHAPVAPTPAAAAVPRARPHAVSGGS
ncbi:MAG: hypothetical protein JO075_15210 [Acidimicrobiia bacterium]|nr:hypothetical protein [Acidimicrobiia bacterium]